MNYMNPYWERRLAECQLGREYAEKRLGQLALLDMDQLTLPFEEMEDHGKPGHAVGDEQH